MFQSYLNNRFQVVKVGENQSKALPVTCGVPQGSILGPLLFLVYINNIQELDLHGHLTLYADDTCLFYFGSSIQILINQAQKDLNTLSIWFQQNLLTINESKTSYIIFRPKNKLIPPHKPLTVNNIPIQEKSNEKYLGLRIDNKLTWNNHIEHIRIKIMSVSGCIRNLVGCIPRNLRYTIYNTLVKPHLMYLIELWGSATKTRLANLQVAQNKVIKILFQYPFRTSTSKIYSETKIMTIQQLYIYQSCLLIRKIIDKNIHSSITFTKAKHLSQRRTRRASFLVLPKTRTSYGRKTLTYEGAQLYNNIPAHIKNVHSFNTFKIKLAEYVLKTYTK